MSNNSATREVCSLYKLLSDFETALANEPKIAREVISICGEEASENDLSRLEVETHGDRLRAAGLKFMLADRFIEAAQHFGDREATVEDLCTAIGNDHLRKYFEKEEIKDFQDIFLDKRTAKTPENFEKEYKDVDLGKGRARKRTVLQIIGAVKYAAAVQRLSTPEQCRQWVTSNLAFLTSTNPPSHASSPAPDLALSPGQLDPVAMHTVQRQNLQNRGDLVNAVWKGILVKLVKEQWYRVQGSVWDCDSGKKIIRYDYIQFTGQKSRMMSAGGEYKFGCKTKLDKINHRNYLKDISGNLTQVGAALSKGDLDAAEIDEPLLRHLLTRSCCRIADHSCYGTVNTMRHVRNANSHFGGTKLDTETIVDVATRMQNGVQELARRGYHNVFPNHAEEDMAKINTQLASLHPDTQKIIKMQDDAWQRSLAEQEELKRNLKQQQDIIRRSQEAHNLTQGESFHQLSTFVEPSLPDSTSRGWYSRRHQKILLLSPLNRNHEALEVGNAIKFAEFGKWMAVIDLDKNSNEEGGARSYINSAHSGNDEQKTPQPRSQAWRVGKDFSSEWDVKVRGKSPLLPWLLVDDDKTQINSKDNSIEPAMEHICSKISNHVLSVDILVMQMTCDRDDNFRLRKALEAIVASLDNYKAPIDCRIILTSLPSIPESSTQAICRDLEEVKKDVRRLRNGPQEIKAAFSKLIGTNAKSNAGGIPIYSGSLISVQDLDEWSEYIEIVKYEQVKAKQRKEVATEDDKLNLIEDFGNYIPTWDAFSHGLVVKRTCIQFAESGTESSRQALNTDQMVNKIERKMLHSPGNSYSGATSSPRIFTLFQHDGAGGTTLVRHVAWSLCDYLPVVIIKPVKKIYKTPRQSDAKGIKNAPQQSDAKEVVRLLLKIIGETNAPGVLAILDLGPGMNSSVNLKSLRSAIKSVYESEDPSDQLLRTHPSKNQEISAQKIWLLVTHHTALRPKWFRAAGSKEPRKKDEEKEIFFLADMNTPSKQEQDAQQEALKSFGQHYFEQVWGDEANPKLSHKGGRHLFGPMAFAARHASITSVVFKHMRKCTQRQQDALLVLSLVEYYLSRDDNYDQKESRLGVSALMLAPLLGLDQRRRIIESDVEDALGNASKLLNQYPIEGTTYLRPIRDIALIILLIYYDVENQIAPLVVEWDDAARKKKEHEERYKDCESALEQVLVFLDEKTGDENIREEDCDTTMEKIAWAQFSEVTNLFNRNHFSSKSPPKLDTLGAVLRLRNKLRLMKESYKKHLQAAEEDSNTKEDMVMASEGDLPEEASSLQNKVFQDERWFRLLWSICKSFEDSNDLAKSKTQRLLTLNDSQKRMLEERRFSSDKDVNQKGSLLKALSDCVDERYSKLLKVLPRACAIFIRFLLPKTTPHSHGAPASVPLSNPADAVLVGLPCGEEKSEEKSEDLARQLVDMRPEAEVLELARNVFSPWSMSYRDKNASEEDGEKSNDKTGTNTDSNTDKKSPRLCIGGFAAMKVESLQMDLAEYDKESSGWLMTLKHVCRSYSGEAQPQSPKPPERGLHEVIELRDLSLRIYEILAFVSDHPSFHLQAGKVARLAYVRGNANSDFIDDTTTNRALKVLDACVRRFKYGVNECPEKYYSAIVVSGLHDQTGQALREKMMLEAHQLQSGVRERQSWSRDSLQKLSNITQDSCRELEEAIRCFEPNRTFCLVGCCRVWSQLAQEVMKPLMKSEEKLKILKEIAFVHHPIERAIQYSTRVSLEVDRLFRDGMGNIYQLILKVGSMREFKAKLQESIGRARKEDYKLLKKLGPLCSNGSSHSIGLSPHAELSLRILFHTDFDERPKKNHPDQDISYAPRYSNDVLFVRDDPEHLDNYTLETLARDFLCLIDKQISVCSTNEFQHAFELLYLLDHRFKDEGKALSLLKDVETLNPSGSKGYQPLLNLLNLWIKKDEDLKQKHSNALLPRALKAAMLLPDVAQRLGVKSTGWAEALRSTQKFAGPWDLVSITSYTTDMRIFGLGPAPNKDKPNPVDERRKELLQVCCNCEGVPKFNYNGLSVRISPIVDEQSVKNRQKASNGDLFACTLHIGGRSKTRNDVQSFGGLTVIPRGDKSLNLTKTSKLETFVEPPKIYSQSTMEHGSKDALPEPFPPSSSSQGRTEASNPTSPSKHLSKSRGNNLFEKYRPKGYVCRFCKKNHLIQFCPQFIPKRTPLCRRCNTKGHWSDQCPTHSGDGGVRQSPQKSASPNQPTPVSQNTNNSDGVGAHLQTEAGAEASKPTISSASNARFKHLGRTTPSRQRGLSTDSASSVGSNISNASSRSRPIRYGNQSANFQGSVSPGYICKICKKPGHHLQVCPERNQSFVPPGYICNICKKPGHHIKVCPERNRSIVPPGYICKICKKPGHDIKNCPKTNSTPFCRRCSTKGHWSDQCPTHSGDGGIRQSPQKSASPNQPTPVSQSHQRVKPKRMPVDFRQLQEEDAEGKIADEDTEWSVQTSKKNKKKTKYKPMNNSSLGFTAKPPDREECYFYHTKKHCYKGDQCPFRH